MTEEKWEDCCDDCMDNYNCEILVARCELVKSRPCDKCRPCEHFKKQHFKRADEMKRK